MRVGEGKQVVAQVGATTINIGDVAAVASAYTDAAVGKVETKFDAVVNGKIANTLDLVTQQTDAMKAVSRDESCRRTHLWFCNMIRHLIQAAFFSNAPLFPFFNKVPLPFLFPPITSPS